MRETPLRFRRLKNMSSDDDRKTSPLPVETGATSETNATPVAATDLLALVQTAPPAFSEPEVLAEGLLFLQQHIPEFTQLSVQEKRSYARAANLDPEFIEGGLQAAEVWRDTKLIVKRTSEELRQERETIARWDKLPLILRAAADGIEAANLKRKHRLGTAILLIYRILGVYVDRNSPNDAYMRPYYENMKRAYLRTQRFRKRTKKEDAPTE